MEVLLVTGGSYWRKEAHKEGKALPWRLTEGFVPLASTEVLQPNSRTWRLTAPLPSATYSLKAASVENNIFIFGENILCYGVVVITFMMMRRYIL